MNSCTTGKDTVGQTIGFLNVLKPQMTNGSWGVEVPLVDTVMKTGTPSTFTLGGAGHPCIVPPFHRVRNKPPQKHTDYHPSHRF